MIPTELNIETYKGSDHDLLFEVKDSNGDPYEFTGTNTLRVFRGQRRASTPFLTIALTWDGTYYSGEISSTDSDIDAAKYPFEWKVANAGAVSHPVKGVMAHSDVYTPTRVTVGTTLTVSTVTNEVTVDGSFTAAIAALAAQTAAELAVEQGQTSIKGVRNITVSATLVLADAGKLIEAEHAVTKIEVTVPADTFADYTTIAVERTGAAEVEILAGGATVINGGRNIDEQYHIVAIQNKGGNVWTAIGGTS